MYLVLHRKSSTNHIFRIPKSVIGAKESRGATAVPRDCESPGASQVTLSDVPNNSKKFHSQIHLVPDLLGNAEIVAGYIKGRVVEDIHEHHGQDPLLPSKVPKGLPE